MIKKITILFLLLIITLFISYKLWFRLGQRRDLKKNTVSTKTVKDTEETKNGDMMFIAGSSFTVGSNKVMPDGRDDKMVRDNETPAHKLDITAFYIDKYEVTNEQFKKFSDATGRQSKLVDPVNRSGAYNWKDGKYKEGEGDNPVVLVNWEEANAFCKWAGKRLPSEMEWEMACRGKDSRRWSFGDDFQSGKANLRDLKLNWSKKPGAFPNDVSPNGVFDMAGNVMEWTASWYLPYPGSEFKDPTFGKIKKVIRGGGWLTGASTARCVNRTVAPAIKRHRALGFRCAKDLQPLN